MGAIYVGTADDFTVEFGQSMDPATINAATIELRDPLGHLVPATVTYGAEAKTATLDPALDLPVIADYFTVTVKGGEKGVVADSGDTLASDFRWSISTGRPLFQEAPAFTGIFHPTVVKFSPDGRIFVAEKAGRIWVFDSESDTTPDLFADLHVNVHNFSDRGLTGMALAPNFPADPHIYVLYTYDGDIPGTFPGGEPAVPAPKFGNGVDLGDPGPGGSEQGPWASGRLSRLTASGNSMVGDEEVLIHDWPQQFESHGVGTVLFGPDGALYVGGGDGASFLYADYGQPVPPGNPGNPFADPPGEGGALRSQDLLTPGDPTTLNGSIIRVDPSTGAALTDNPLIETGTDENARRIIAHGFRNPYRFAFRPGTNEIWIGDVGWEDWEEIDRIVSPTDDVVENFGWPAYEGPVRQEQYDLLDVPLVESIYAAGPDATEGPYFAYHHFQNVDPAVDESLSKFAAITGVAFAQGGKLPAAFDGALFFADYVRNLVWVMYRGVDGLPDPTNVHAFSQAAERPVDLEIGPDGSLYYVNFQNTIGRMEFVAPDYSFRTSDGNDALTIRASEDLRELQIFEDYPPADGSSPIFTWPMDARMPLQIFTGAGNDAIAIELPPGIDGPAGGIRIDAGSGTNSVRVESGRVSVDLVATGGSVAIIIGRGAEINTTVFRDASLVLAGKGAKATILPGGQMASLLTSLSIAPGATLDITDNALVIDYTGTSPVDFVRNEILAGRDGVGVGNGRWTGVGITSSTAAQANIAMPESHSVGYAENAALPLGRYDVFRGQTVDETSVLIAYVTPGDTTLDGLVNDDVVTMVSALFAQGVPQPAWALGDFDYNGFVDDDDVTLLAALYLPTTMASGVEMAGAKAALPDSFVGSVTSVNTTLTQPSLANTRGKTYEPAAAPMSPPKRLTTTFGTDAQDSFFGNLGSMRSLKIPRRGGNWSADELATALTS
jgi:glucose/arabinose dehydrogenase